jgi:hypothetical protein
MLNRREFLGSAAALGASLLSPLQAEDHLFLPTINETLTMIAEKLESLNCIARVDKHLNISPSVGAVHWRWVHFFPDLDPLDYRPLEMGNEQLLKAMTIVHDMPGSGLDTLMHEGIVDGAVDAHMKSARKEHEALVRMQRTMNFSDTDPSPEVIASNMKDPRSFQEPIFQVWNQYDQKERSAKISPLGKLGAGYALSTQRPVSFIATEDPIIDGNAEQAVREKNSTYNYWVFWKRERHIVQLLRAMNKKIVHILFGANHDFHDDIRRSNLENREKISEIVVTVEALREVPFITPRV